MNKIITIDSGLRKESRPNERPPKSNWRIEMVKKGLSMLQYITASKTAEVIWHYFTQPGSARFTDPQKELLNKAEVFKTSYQGQEIFHYRWGADGHKKVLLSHGWRSKAADFRRLIEALVEDGYCVESMDMTAHGHSQGKHSALPEFRDVLKDHYTKHGPYDTLLGYSLGGLAAGLVASELASDFQPKNLILIAAPPFAKYFFHDIIKELGFKHEVYESFLSLVEKHYNQPVDYFDLRSKIQSLKNIRMQFIYDQDDETVPFDRGKELHQTYPDAQFVNTIGLGHYKIISSELITEHIVSTLKR